MAIRADYTLDPHAGEVKSIAFSPDGTQLKTWSVDMGDTPVTTESLSVWSAATGRRLFRKLMDVTDDLPIAFRPDRDVIALGTSGGVVQEWDRTKDQPTTRVRLQSCRIGAVDYSGDGSRIVTVGAADRMITVWTRDSPPFMALGDRPGKRPQKQIWKVAYSPDGRSIATGSQDGILRIWETASWRQLGILTLSGGAAMAVAFSRDGQRLAAGSGDGSTCLWDAATRRLVRIMPGQDGAASALAFSPDGRRLAIAHERDAVVVSDARSFQELYRLPANGSEVAALAFSPDGRRLAIGQWDSTVTVCDGATGQVLWRVKGTRSVWCVTFSPDQRRVVSTDTEGSIRFLDAETGRGVLVIPAPGGEVYSADFSPDGKQLVTGHHDGIARVWTASDP